ncbi:hypothetical protein PRU_0968 [Xylanibacter ruminicola 23]|uniref:Uncharacterized protein n=2 Tax=Xylanibacter ruminicola TaxID=839 RepID=D5ERQ1_XYLR2|nr:hypothetical protein PRU_0968 [Xylanibacter ruminicola 23]
MRSLTRWNHFAIILKLNPQISKITCSVMDMCIAKSNVSSALLDITQSKMITKDSIETAYSFLHQKQRIYVHSTLDWQKDDIEMAIAAYADDMSQELFEAISGGRADFLHDHKQFQEDITKAVEILENML